MKIPKDEDASQELIFRDSFNYVSQKLDALVKAFNLPVEPKMFFPHMYNLEKNYDTIIPHLPPITTIYTEVRSQKRRRPLRNGMQSTIMTNSISMK